MFEPTDPTQFRNQVQEASGKSISSEQAKNFLEIFGGELTECLVRARRSFIEKHFGSKNGTNSTGPGA